MIEKNLNERRQVEKKILPEYYKEICTHRKMFEIRKDEDNFQVGDIIVLREWDGEKYTGNKTRREITYILRNAEGYGLKEGYCILSLQVPGWDHFRPQAVLDEEKTQLSEETSTNKVDTPTNTPTDLISRQAAIEALGEEPDIAQDTDEEWAEHDTWVIHRNAIGSLPPETHDKRTETHGVCSDCISRQDALKPFCITPDGTRIPEVDCDNFPVEFSVEFIKKHLLSLPSSEPKLVSGDTVSKEELIQSLLADCECKDRSEAKAVTCSLDTMLELIDDASPVEPKRPKGEWKYGNGNGECPFCGHERQYGWDNFCGFCGADMRGDK